MRLVLASASPRRRELLAELGVPFEVVVSGVDEEIEQRDPLMLARVLALRKARAVAASSPGDAVLGADTVVVLDDAVLGKPADAAKATAMLQALRDRRHTVITAVALIVPDGEAVDAAATAVEMRGYGDDEIARYVARGEPFDKAGGYAVQDQALHPARAVEGCECAVIGLPLWTVHTLLRAAGIEAATPSHSRCAACPLRPPG